MSKDNLCNGSLGGPASMGLDNDLNIEQWCALFCLEVLLCGLPAEEVVNYDTTGGQQNRPQSSSVVYLVVSRQSFHFCGKQNFDGPSTSTFLRWKFAQLSWATYRFVASRPLYDVGFRRPRPTTHSFANWQISDTNNIMALFISSRQPASPEAPLKRRAANYQPAAALSNFIWVYFWFLESEDEVF